MKIVETKVVTAQDPEKLSEARLEMTRELAHKYGEGTMITYVPASVLIVTMSAK